VTGFGLFCFLLFFNAVRAQLMKSMGHTRVDRRIPAKEFARADVELVLDLIARVVPVCCGWYGADDDEVGDGVEVVRGEELVVGAPDETVPTTQ
jgi:hypothetical protein